MRRLPLVSVTLAATLCGVVTPLPSGASTTSVSAVTPTTLLSSVPVVRLTVSQTGLRADQLPRLTITPAIATAWSQVGSTTFQAMITGAGFVPMTTYVVSVPTGLSCATSCSFTGTRAVSVTAQGSLVWLDQLLAEGGYLPVAFTPSGGTPPAGTTTTQSTSTSTTTTLPPFTPSSTIAPTPGTFSWRFPNLPPSAKALWSVGTLNPLVKAALARFQGLRGLPVTGQPSMWTWKLLLGRLSIGQFDSGPYAYVDVTESRPETMTLYLDGVVAVRSPANTGIYAAPTTLGSFFVYVKYRSQTMRGTNPDGTTYNDPGVPFVSYFYQAEALHYFTRPGYGWPQSLGCIELPYATASTIWPLTPIGTVVTIRR